MWWGTFCVKEVSFIDYTMRVGLYILGEEGIFNCLYKMDFLILV